MIRSLAAAALLVAVVAGGFVVGAVNAITRETWPDWYGPPGPGGDPGRPSPGLGALRSRRPTQHN
jgi:hypothetical protein